MPEAQNENEAKIADAYKYDYPTKQMIYVWRTLFMSAKEESRVFALTESELIQMRSTPRERSETQRNIYTRLTVFLQAHGYSENSISAKDKGINTLFDSTHTINFLAYSELLVHESDMPTIHERPAQELK